MHSYIKFVLILIITSLSLVACDETSNASSADYDSPKSSNSETGMTDKSIEPSQHTAIKQKPKPDIITGCPGKIELVLNDIKLNPPKNWGGMVIYMKDGSVINSQSSNHPSKDCSYDSITNVTSFSTGTLGNGHRGFGISAIDKSNNTAFGNKPIAPPYTKDVLVHSQDAKIFQNGIKKISLNNKEYYILPYSEAPTFDDTPVILECDGLATSPDVIDFCKTQYVLPDGYAFSYSFYRKFYTEADYIEADAAKRSEYQQLKTSL